MNKHTITSHPGDILLDEIKARGLKKMAFAEQIQLSKSHFSDIIHAKRGMTEPLAQKLEEVLGIPAAFWMEVQANWDHWYDGRQCG